MLEGGIMGGDGDIDKGYAVSHGGRGSEDAPIAQARGSLGSYCRILRRISGRKLKGKRKHQSGRNFKVMGLCSREFISSKKSFEIIFLQQ